MPCFHPWEPSPSMGLGPMVKQLPCGQCSGCRLERSRQQAARCIHESKSHRYNTWATLTYDHDHLPQRYNTGLVHPHTRQPIYSGSLDKLHVPKFIRSLRKSAFKLAGISFDLRLQDPDIYHTNADRSSTRQHSNTTTLHAALRLRPHIRYYYSGEYGERYRRPHYHICLFGIDFNDKKYVETTDAGYKLYVSKTLEKLWPHGQHLIGELTFETAAYTARYIMKKITGKQAHNHYQALNTETGEILQLVPEFNEASRRPGLGRAHYEKFKTDFYKQQTSSINVRGHQSKPPRYYDKQYEKHNPEHYAAIKFARQMDAIKNKKNHTPARLAAEEIITASKLKSLKGTL